MPTHVLATGTPFANPSGMGGAHLYGYMQWLYDVDVDGSILDHRTVLSLPVYTNNGCKKFDGTGDYAEVDSSAALGNFGTNSFTIEVECDFTTPAANRAIVSKYKTTTNERSWSLQLQTTGIFFASSTLGTSATLKTISLSAASIPQRVARAVFTRVGTGMTVSFDGGAPIAMTGSGVVEDIFSSTAPIRIGSIVGGTYYNSHMSRVAIPGIFDYSLADGPNLKLYDRSGLGHDATFTSTSGIDTMAATCDGASPLHIINGFSLYTHATLDPLRVPYDINGDPLSITPPTGYTLANEYPAGYLVSNTESTITQTDDFFIDGTINFYSADGASQDDKTYADFLAHEPFKYNLLLQWKSVGGVCLGCEAIQLPLAYTWTKAKYNAALAFMHEFTSDCGARIFTVTEPTGGWLRTFNPNTATAGDAYDFLATLVHDMHTGFQTYTVTEPTGGWVRTFDSMDGGLALWTVQDVLATVAHDIGSTVQTYTLNTGGTELYTFNPNTATFNNAANVLYSLMLKLKHFGFIQ